MITQETMRAVMQEHAREATELVRQREALARDDRRAAPRSGLSPIERRSPLPRFIARVLNSFL